MTAADIITCVLLLVGVFFSFVGVVGVLRLPDVYGRLQASTCIASMGNIFVIIGGIVYAATHWSGAGTIVKLVLIMLMVLLTNPVSNHSLLKGAYRNGVKPERENVMDDYKEDEAE